MNVVDVLLAKFQELIVQAIPQIILLLSHSEWNIRRTGAAALSKISMPGKALTSLT